MENPRIVLSNRIKNNNIRTDDNKRWDIIYCRPL